MSIATQAHVQSSGRRARDTLDELVCGLARLSRTAVTYLVRALLWP